VLGYRFYFTILWIRNFVKRLFCTSIQRKEEEIVGLNSVEGGEGGEDVLNKIYSIGKEEGDLNLVV